MPDNPGHTPGTHWAMRVDFSESVSGPSIKPGLGAAVGILEIRNLDSGEIGTYGMASLDVGFGIGLGASLGNGEWSVFETAHPETLHSFEGHIRTPSTQVGRWSVESRIVLPVEIKHDSWLGAVWNHNSVDVSRTSSSLGLGTSDGEGVLHLEHVTQGVPEPNLLDGVAERFYEQFETSHPDLQPTPPDGEGPSHDDGTEELISFPSASGPGDPANSGLASPLADLADSGAAPRLVAPDLGGADFSPVGLSTGDLSAPEPEHPSRAGRSGRARRPSAARMEHWGCVLRRGTRRRQPGNPAGSWRGRLPGGPEQLRRPTGSYTDGSPAVLRAAHPGRRKGCGDDLEPFAVGTSADGKELRIDPMNGT